MKTFESNEQTIDLTAIVVSYNTRELTLDCLRSVIQAQCNLSIEIIVVDNNSDDGTAFAIKKDFPEVILILNKENRGFAAANNQGLMNSHGRYVLLLNSDTIIRSDTLTVMHSFMENNYNVGVVGCKVLLPNGELDRACRRSFPALLNSICHIFGLDKIWPKNRYISSYNLLYKDENDTYEVDCIVGAFMFVRNEVVLSVGLLDEQFFMYGEDVDWCYRIKKQKWEIWYCPKTSIIHLKGGSRRRRNLATILNFYDSMALYYKKHFSSKHSVITSYTVLTGITAIKLLSIFINLVNSVYYKCFLYEN